MGRPFLNIDVALLKKYDRPGPRYTSYPTAPLFHPSFTAGDFRDEILATNAPGTTSELSLYVHIPFCDTLCFFCGCTMLVTRDRKRIDEYLRYLKTEITRVAELVAPGRRVTQLHWGGGTPTHLTPEQMLDLAAALRSAFTFSPDAECSVEVDPRELDRRHLEALAEAGFNRMSMGVQDFELQVQSAVNRIQPESISRQVYTWARELGFSSINIDLMYGLPHQTVESFRRTIHGIIEYSPDRIAVFNYAHVPWLKPHQKLIHQEALPTPEAKLDILKMTIELLTESGFEYIGMDHFAKPDDELARARASRTLYRNFQGYSTKAGADLYGFGMSAISHFQNVYAQNAKALPDYYKALDAGSLATVVGYRMTPDDHVRKHVIMRLMCDLELDIASIERRFGIRFAEYFGLSLAALTPLEEDGLVKCTADRIQIVGPGRLLLRNIAMCFDAYLDRLSKDKPVFSRTV
ncbi:MAG: oxygen-independent coproporphyrinogen III oxidase [Bacteroidetes bacterium]|nr:oxygen-independent coproporphyrinogen III oxidase [Bacteroidota bacterium]